MEVGRGCFILCSFQTLITSIFSIMVLCEPDENERNRKGLGGGGMGRQRLIFHLSLHWYVLNKQLKLAKIARPGHISSLAGASLILKLFVSRKVLELLDSHQS